MSMPNARRGNWQGAQLIGRGRCNNRVFAYGASACKFDTPTAGALCRRKIAGILQICKSFCAEVQVSSAAVKTLRQTDVSPYCL